MASFTGSSILVIGGSSGMGLGAARALVARGADVLVTSRSAARLDEAVAAVTGDLQPRDGVTEIGTAAGIVCDLGDESSVRAAVAAPARLDHLLVTAAPGRGVTDREFFDGKFWGSRAACDAAAERLPDTGCVILTSGGLAVRPSAGQWSVTTAFAAVEALARAMAVELAPRRAVCIRPGLFDTATWSGMDAADRAGLFADRSAVLPAGRPGSPEDFGDAVVGILASRYLTGQVVVLDGGEALLGG